MNRRDLQLPDYSGNILGSMTDDLVEQEMICSLSTYPLNFTQVDDILTDDCFFNPKNRDIFCIIRDRILANQEVDMTSIGMLLLKEKKSDYSNYFIHLMMNHRATSILREKAAHLATLTVRRKMYLNAKFLSDGMVDTTQNIDAVIEESQRRISEAYSLPENHMTNGREVYEHLQYRVLENMSRNPGDLYGTPTGFDNIDQAGGLCPGDLNIIGAETSQGKTSFATALAVAAIAHGHGVAFYSMEMQKEQVMARITSMRSGISSSQILITPLNMKALHHMDASMSDLNLELIHFDERSKSTLDSILLSIRRMVANKGIKGAVVDYLQLVSVSDSRLNREQATAQCARAFKNLAKELGIWIIVISQMSRSGNATGAPSIARLRDSGQIEEAADNVYLIYRPADNTPYPAPYADVETQGTAMVKIAKGRNTGTGSFICGFEPSLTLFYPLNGANPRFTHSPVAPYDAFDF